MAPLRRTRRRPEVIKKALTVLVYVAIIGLMVWDVVTRLAGGCRQFMP